MQAMLDLLAQQWTNAEQRYLNAGLVDDAIASCLECHKWPDAIRIAEQNHHYDVDTYKASYMDHLMQTNQLEQAGRVNEEHGEIQVCLLVHAS